VLTGLAMVTALIGQLQARSTDGNPRPATDPSPAARPVPADR
jgi:hypothetical protein